MEERRWWGWERSRKTGYSSYWRDLFSSCKKFLFRQVSSSLLSLPLFLLLFLLVFLPILILPWKGKERPYSTLKVGRNQRKLTKKKGEKEEEKETKRKKVGKTNLQIFFQGKTQFKIHWIQFSWFFFFPLSSFRFLFPPPFFYFSHQFLALILFQNSRDWEQFDDLRKRCGWRRMRMNEMMREEDGELKMERKQETIWESNLLNYYSFYFLSLLLSWKNWMREKREQEEERKRMRKERNLKNSKTKAFKS